MIATGTNIPGALRTDYQLPSIRNTSFRVSVTQSNPNASTFEWARDTRMLMLTGESTTSRISKIQSHEPSRLVSLKLELEARTTRAEVWNC